MKKRRKSKEKLNLEQGKNQRSQEFCQREPQYSQGKPSSRKLDGKHNNGYVEETWQSIVCFAWR